ncbi:MAG: dephospho-CoA kinase [Actinomycetota bacterium]
MPTIGLAGGFASGKSTVAEMFRTKGAAVLDADDVARAAVVPGTPALARIRQRFGESVFLIGGSLNRSELAQVVFSDPQARADLNAILHPLIFAELRRLIAEAPPKSLNVVEAALLVESAPWNSGELALDALVVVDCPTELQVARAVAGRGIGEAEARARIGAQIPRNERRAAADYLIDNSGSPEELYARFQEVWDELSARTGWSPGFSAPLGGDAVY